MFGLLTRFGKQTTFGKGDYDMLGFLRVFGRSASATLKRIYLTWLQIDGTWDEQGEFIRWTDKRE